jgi:hypothetical protein
MVIQNYAYLNALKDKIIHIPLLWAPSGDKKAHTSQKYRNMKILAWIWWILVLGGLISAVTWRVIDGLHWYNTLPLILLNAYNLYLSLPFLLWNEQSKSAHPWWDFIKSALLAKAPLEGAPLEYGGHRVAEEPTKKLDFGGVLAKFARFFGPGMIITVAYIDPDNFQTSFEDGQDFGYKMLFMVLFSLILAIYLQVSGSFF